MRCIDRCDGIPGVLTPVTTRFSDFGPDGLAHESRVLMFFEAARFDLAERSGIHEALREAYGESNFQFLVNRLSYRVRQPARLGTTLWVSTRLRPPTLSRLDFSQSLIDEGAAVVFAEATVEIALVSHQRGLLLSLAPTVKSRVAEYLQSERIGAS